MLDATIAREILWRKSEITNLHASVRSAPNEQVASALRRSAYCVFYAHWEGAIKRMAQAYASSVRTSGLRIDELAYCYRAMIAKSAFEQSSKSKKLTPYVNALREFEERKSSHVYFDFDEFIKAEGNLKSDVLREIHICIGIEYGSYFQLKEKYIDMQLVKRRNALAHGENIPIEEDVFELAYKEVPEMFVKFSEILSENFRNRSFAA